MSNANRVVKAKRFFFCPECNRSYELWRNPGFKRTFVRQEFLPDGWPTIGLLHVECEECKNRIKELKDE